MRLKYVVRNVPKGLLSSYFPEQVVAADTTLQQPHFLRRNGHLEYNLLQLFGGIVCREAEYPALAGPLSISGDQKKPCLR